MPYFDTFRSELEKAIVIFEISTFEFVFKNWDQNCLIWLFFYWNFKKLLSCLKSAPLNFLNC